MGRGCPVGGEKLEIHTNQLLAGVVVLSLFGLAVGRLINWAETRLLHRR
jgi:ABC-type nitrate/sulfonate/bicarbonate transport system permease component